MKSNNSRIKIKFLGWLLVYFVDENPLLESEKCTLDGLMHFCQ
jgi:hypothetical protein